MTTNCYDSTLKKSWEFYEQVKESIITIQNHTDNKITEENLLTLIICHTDKEWLRDRKKPLVFQDWFKRVKLSHLRYGQRSSTSKEKTQRSLMPSFALNLYHSPTLPLSSWYSTELRRVSSRKLNYLAFSVKSAVFMR